MSEASQAPYKFLGWGLLATIVIALCALPLMDWSSFPEVSDSEIAIKLVLMVAAFAAILYREYFPGNLKEKQAGVLLLVMAVIAAGAYFNFGKFHGRSYNHVWEQFHYVLGAKYFPELRYDGLYVASISAQKEKSPSAYRGYVQDVIRDLRTNEMVETNSVSVLQHMDEVKARFTEARWQQFVDDNYFFLSSERSSYIRRVREDHGFNPPPSWTFTAQLFTHLEINQQTLVLLASIDCVMLAGLFAMIYVSFGAKLAALAVIVFGLNYMGRFYWVGGSFLREDWLLWTVTGICLLKRRYFVWAGFFIGWAASVRVFPVLFLFGPAVLGLKALIHRQPLLNYWKIAGGFLAALGVMFILGCFTGRGLDGWLDFFESISVHSNSWLSNNVGLQYVLLFDLELIVQNSVDQSMIDPWIHITDLLYRLQEERMLLIFAVKATALIVIGMICWNSRIEDAAIIGGLTVIFIMLMTTNYYWQMLLLVPLLRNRMFLYSALILNISQAIWHFYMSATELRYALFTVGYTIILLVFFWWQLRNEEWRKVFRSPSVAAEPQS